MNTIPPAPRADQIRAALLDRARAYAGLMNGLSLSRVSVVAAGDGKFLPDVARGRGFTLDRYGKVMEWFEQNWPPTEEAIRQKLLSRAYEFAHQRGIRLTDVGRLARTEPLNFFLLLETGDIELTRRRYDQLMGWFDANWHAKTMEAAE